MQYLLFWYSRKSFASGKDIGVKNKNRGAHMPTQEKKINKDIVFEHPRCKHIAGPCAEVKPRSREVGTRSVVNICNKSMRKNFVSDM